MAGEANKQEDIFSGYKASRTEQLVEVIIFLLLILPSLVLSLFVAGSTSGVTFVLEAVATIVRDAALVALVLFFVWHDRELFTRLGWTLEHVWREIGLGVLLFPVLFFGSALLESAFQAVGLSVPSGPLPSYLSPTGYAQIALAFLLVVVVAIAEETIFRGYLIQRFNNVIGSMAASVILSAIVFAVGHGYEGSAGVATVGSIGLGLAIVYIWRKSLVAPMVLHFLLDFISLVLVPLLATAQVSLPPIGFAVGGWPAGLGNLIAAIGIHYSRL